VRAIIKDVDLDGKSADVIDILESNITVDPASNATFAKPLDLHMSNIAT